MAAARVSGWARSGPSGTTHRFASPVLGLVAAALGGCAATVDLRLEVPAETPALLRVELVTDRPEPGDRIPLTRITPTLYAGALAVPRDGSVTVRPRLGGDRAGLDADWAELAVAIPGDDPGPVHLRVAHWAVQAPDGGTRVRLFVQIPETSPVDATVWLRGPSELLGADRPDGLKLSREPDGRHAVELALATGVPFEYRYSLGTDYRVELDASRQRVARVIVPGGGALELHHDIVERWQGETLTGDVRVHRLAQEGDDAPRRILVYLPPGHEADPARRYPVLYLQDGEQLMDALTAEDEWRVDETAERLIAEGAIPPVIIVGVYSRGAAARVQDYTHVSLEGYPYTGGATAYGEFLLHTVKPFVDAHYPTRPGPDDTAIGGAELGGLVSLWLALQPPATFGRVAALSPSTWFADADIVRQVEALPAKPPLRVWLDVGTAETFSEAQRAAFALRHPSAVGYARELREALVAEGWVAGEDLAYVEVSGAVPNALAWRTRLPDVLRWLYPPAR